MCAFSRQGTDEIDYYYLRAYESSNRHAGAVGLKIMRLLELSKRKNLDGSRDNGVGMWVQEIGMSIPHNIVFLYVPIHL